METIKKTTIKEIFGRGESFRVALRNATLCIRDKDSEAECTVSSSMGLIGGDLSAPFEGVVRFESRDEKIKFDAFILSMEIGPVEVSEVAPVDECVMTVVGGTLVVG